MKRKNFPGRKMQRCIDAAIRAEGRPYRNYTEAELNGIALAGSHRSKKRAA